MLQGHARPSRQYNHPWEVRRSTVEGVQYLGGITSTLEGVQYRGVLPSSTLGGVYYGGGEPSLEDT